MTSIVFFSSDARELYKNDVFRCLSLPKGYCVRFRYLTKYLWKSESFGDTNDSDEEKHRKKVASLKEKFDGFRNKDASIFFVAGNQELQPAEQFQYHCIRRVIVQDYFYEEDLDEFNFILKLEEFENAEIQADPDKMPPTTWVSELDVVNRQPQRWIDRVKAVEYQFESTLFFYLKRVLKEAGGAELDPTFSKRKGQSYFQLDDESNYILESIFYDPTGDLPIKCETDEDSITISHPKRVGAIQDHKRLTLHTKILSQQSAEALTYFYGSKNFYVELNWSIRKPWTRTIQFGLLTFVAAIGTCLLFLARLANLSEMVFSPRNLLAAASGAVMIGFAASSLYHLFHKK